MKQEGTAPLQVFMSITSLTPLGSSKFVHLGHALLELLILALFVCMSLGLQVDVS